MSVRKSDEKLLLFHPQSLLLKSFCLGSNIKHLTQCFFPSNGAQEQYLLDTKVNTPFFQVPTLEFSARV